MLQTKIKDVTNRKEHWEKVYAGKDPHELSWTQQRPAISLDFLHSLHLEKSARIIDIGGGNSRLAECLLDEGYENITVLDISETAIEKAKLHLGERASRVTWITDDVTRFQPSITYDCWHDRATFHFLTDARDVDTYLATARKAVTGYLVIGTFSEKGPEKCSRLDVHRYSEEELQHQLADGFEKIRCVPEVHTTPFNTTQNFLFCSFRRQATNINANAIMR